jgi:1-acyl-sn-glycerol-3-phosphate acyltransferase
MATAPSARPHALPVTARVRRADWPYTWGRAIRWISVPFDLLYHVAVNRTIVLGGEHLAGLSPRVIFAGTHHSFADVPLIRRGLALAGQGRLARRLLIAAGAEGFPHAGLWGRYTILAFGLFPLRHDGHGRESLDDLARVAAAGNAPLIFAQGQHARPEQERAGDRAVRFRQGVAYLSDALDAPVVPFGLAGTERVMPAFLDDFKGRVIAGVPVAYRRGPLAIGFGPPLRRAPDETPRAFTERLQATSYALTRRCEAAVGEELATQVRRGNLRGRVIAALWRARRSPRQPPK